MNYDKTKLKKLRGSLVKMKYITKDESNNLTGVIEYLSNDYFMFGITGGNDVRVNYSNVEEIEKVRSFNSYIKSAKNYANLFLYQKAFDIVFKLRQDQLFKLPVQIEEIDRLRIRYQGKLMQRSRDPKGLYEAIMEDEVIELREKLTKISKEKNNEL